MNPSDTELFLTELNKLKELLKRVEGGHSFSIINYESVFADEAEILKEFDIADEASSLYPVSNYIGGNFETLTKEKAFYQFKKWLKEAFDFNVRFSGKTTEANQIKTEVDNQIGTIIKLTKRLFSQVTEVEMRTVDRGGYDLVRLEFKKIGGNEVFEFNYFID